MLLQPVSTYSPRSKMGTLLPEFPSIEDLKLPADIETEKLLTFIMMYRTHSQRILDTVIRANFDEVILGPTCMQECHELYIDI